MAKVAEDAELRARSGRAEQTGNGAQAGAGVQALLQTDPTPSQPQEGITDSRKDGTASPAGGEAGKVTAQGCAREGSAPGADPAPLCVCGPQG